MPASTPLAVGGRPTPATASSAQRRLAILDALTKDPNVSQEAKEWAADVLQELASRK